MANNGGPAFPGIAGEHGYGDCVKRVHPDGDVSWVTHNQGMSLRDYFAAAALNGMLSSQSDDEELPSSPRAYFETMARGAYIAADAMLAERVK